MCYELWRKHRCGRLEGVEWCADARFSTACMSDHSGICGCVFQEYLQQETFLRVVWEVLALRASCVVCDEDCVHRAAGVTLAVQQMTGCNVSWYGMGVHRCIQEFPAPGFRGMRQGVRFACDRYPHAADVDEVLGHCRYSPSAVDGSTMVGSGSVWSPRGPPRDARESDQWGVHV